MKPPKKNARATEDQNVLLKDQNRILQQTNDALKSTAKQQLAADVAAAIFSTSPIQVIMPLLGRAAILLGESSEVLLSIAALKRMIVAVEELQYEHGPFVPVQTDVLNVQLHFLIKLILILAGGMSEEDAITLISSSMKASIS